MFDFFLNENLQHHVTMATQGIGPSFCVPIGMYAYKVRLISGIFLSTNGNCHKIFCVMKDILRLKC